MESSESEYEIENESQYISHVNKYEGIRYIGEFKDGMKNGKGIYYFSNGKDFENDYQILKFFH
jgi:hypothetical protein